MKRLADRLTGAVIATQGNAWVWSENECAVFVQVDFPDEADWMGFSDSTAFKPAALHWPHMVVDQASMGLLVDG